MPTRKQRRRVQKSKRHEYEFVYLDEDGNELSEDEVPEEVVAAPVRREQRTNGSKPAARSTPTRPTRARREPQPPSWGRAAKRSAIFGVILVVIFALGSKGSYVRALPEAIAFTVVYVPIMYYIDRMAYRRWQLRKDAAPPARPAKKR
ncbi:MAG TPA: hypothetical protein VFA30_08400 [Gaiellaceae bacterium]|nr:hypothetical protein [Gaiellaceae bacterium]